MSNNDDNEAALIDSFFLPGGILDPTSFDSDSNEEVENIDNNDRGFGFPVRQGKGPPVENPIVNGQLMSNRIETSSSQNPWAVPVEKSIHEPCNSFAPKELGFWEQPQQYNHQGNISTTRVTSGSRLSTTSDKASVPALLSGDLASQLFSNTNNHGPHDLFGNGLARKTQQTELSQHGREILQPQLPASTGGASIKPLALPLETYGTHQSRISNSTKSGIPREVDFLTNMDNFSNSLGKYSSGQTINDESHHEVSGGRNPNLGKRSELPPPPPGFAPPPGFEQTVPNHTVFDKVVSGSRSESDCDRRSTGKLSREAEKDAEDESVYDDFPLEMLHTRGNDKRSCTESETSSLSELTSCGDEETPSDDDEEEQEEQEPDLQKNMQEENENGTVKQQDYEEDLAQRSFRSNKEDSKIKLTEQVEQTDVSGTPGSTLRQRRSSLESPKVEHNSHDSGNSAEVTDSGRKCLSDMLESARSTVSHYVSSLSKSKATPIPDARKKSSSKSKRRRQNKRSMESEESKYPPSYRPKVKGWLLQMSDLFLDRFQSIVVLLGNAKRPTLFAHLGGKLYAAMIIMLKGVFMAGAVTFLVTKHAFLELLEENGLYTGSYVCFYMMPAVTSIMMEMWALPHWAPHFLSCTALFIVCREEGENPFRKIWGGSSDPPNDGQDILSSDFGKQTLFLFRCFLPVMFLLDGFTYEDGFLMSLSPAARLVCGYVVSLFKVGCPLSPIGWLSCAIQILAVHYCPQTYSILDKYILILGMATIRFIRALAMVGKKIESMKKNRT